MDRNTIIERTNRYFASQPVTKAWLFGSYSRNEQREDSDVDILVVFDKDAKVGLFKYSGIQYELKKLLGKQVDLVEEGTLKPFAVNSANADKILIYERAN